MSDHSAPDIYVAFNYQGLYALIELLDSEDDLAKIALETSDDLELVGENPKLLQLKHSMGTPPALTIKNDGLWKAIHNWIPHISEEAFEFCFITVSGISEKSILIELTRDAKSKDTLKVLEALNDEANLVIKERDFAVRSGGKVPHQKRWKGCELYLNLRDSDKLKLIRRMKITPHAVTAYDFPREIERRLRHLPQKNRFLVAERLIEWWDRQCAKSLLNQRQKYITREEITSKEMEIIQSCSPDNLPDDFGTLMPPESEFYIESPMVTQITLVKGRESIKKMAIRDRWRARNQRNRWLKDSLVTTFEIDDFDGQLREKWKDNFEIICEDCFIDNADPEEKGRELLNWVAREASNEVPLIRSHWKQAYLVHGTYQQMSSELKIGWHPRWECLMKDIKKKVA